MIYLPERLKGEAKWDVVRARQTASTEERVVGMCSSKIPQLAVGEVEVIDLSRDHSNWRMVLVAITLSEHFFDAFGG